jgi:hypothetical protein
MTAWLPVRLAAAALFLGIACGGGERGAPSQATSGGGERDAESTATAPLRLPGWQTDFSKASIGLDELTQGAVRDGIPALSQPLFLAVSKVDFLKDVEPVIAFREGDDARAYPLQILIWHEIVNDVVGGRPVLITFCPLCNTAIAFDRTVNGKTLDFGVSGFLRNSDLVMYDQLTESFWQQATGEALIGAYLGTRLELLPSSIISWADFKEAFPNGLVLSRETGHSRQYGTNPYVGYDNVKSIPFLFDGKPDRRLQAMERVVTVEIDGEVVAYPFSRLEANPVVHDTVGGREIVILFKRGTTSALDRSSIADSSDIGSATVFSREVDGRRLTFSADGKTFRDGETGSSWDILGRAVAGPLRGKSLRPIVSGNHFWFAWAAFEPQTRVWDGR